MATNAPNVWAQMDYIPPRGQCNFKQSVLSPRCPCLRFMLHPMKSSSSYECDGCSHHASFHSMENKAEDDVRKRWEQEAREKAEHEEQIERQPKKRVRTIEYSSSRSTMDVEPEDLLQLQGTRARTKASGKGKAVASRSGKAAVTKAKSRITEVVEDEEDDVVELD